MHEFDDVVLQCFLDNQKQLFPEPVANSLEEAEAFLEEVMALVVNSPKEVELSGNSWQETTKRALSGLHVAAETEENGLFKLYTASGDFTFSHDSHFVSCIF